MTSSWDGSSAGPGVEIGDVIADKFRITSLLGAGGMGVVFAARHTKLDGEFALKFLSRDAAANSQAVERFSREARAAAKLTSEHAVRVFDIGTHTNGLPYIVMEYLEGRDLATLLRETGPLEIPRALDYLRQTCAAIAAAHKAGIIHRDLKPSNLFCANREGQSPIIKVLDFGISKLTDAAPGAGGFTLTNNLVGSPSYMSPEQMRTPNRVDFRTDIWSLGVVLYECLTAKLPFPASTLPELCLRVAEEPPIAPRMHRPELPLELERLILKCLEKDPGKRFDSVSEFSNSLRALETQLGPARQFATLTHEFVMADAARSSAPPNVAATPTNPSWERSARAPALGHRPFLVALVAAGVVASAGVAAVVVQRVTLGAGASSAAAPLPSASVRTSASVEGSAARSSASAGVPAARTDTSAVSAASSAPSTAAPAPSIASSRPARSPTRSPASALASPHAPSANPLPTKPAVERNTQTKTWKR